MAKSMIQMHDWENESSLIQHLAEQLIRGRLTIFLGAGISLEFGLPNWEGLVKGLCDQVGHTFSSKINLTTTISAIKEDHFNGNEKAYIAAIGRVLYKNATMDFKDLSSSATFRALGSLVMASARGGVSTVVTLNYDDALELYLEGFGFVVDSVAQGVHWASRADVTVLHPHGLIPYPTRSARKATESIVLDNLSFSTIVGDSTLPWYQRIITCLRTSTVLMIGLSGNDANLNALLASVRKAHPIHEAGYLFLGVMLAKAPAPEEVSVMKSYRVHVHKLTDFDQHLPAFLFSICQKAAEIRSAQP